MESLSTLTLTLVHKRRILSPILVAFIFIGQNIVFDLFLINVDKEKHSPLLLLDLGVLIICMIFIVKAKWGIRHPNIYWIIWLIMSCDIFYKLALIFIAFEYQLDKVRKLAFLDHNALDLLIYLDCLIFKIFLESQYSSSLKSRETAFVNFISGTVYIDYVDAGMFWGILYKSEVKSLLPIAMRYVVMFTVFFILTIPSLVLFILSKYQYGVYKVSQLKLYLLRMVLVLLVNVPGLTVRIVLLMYHGSISMMIIKNALLIIISVQEFVTLSNQESDEDSTVSSVVSSIIDSDAVYLMLDDVFKSSNFGPGARNRDMTDADTAFSSHRSLQASVPMNSSIGKMKQIQRTRFSRSL